MRLRSWISRPQKSLLFVRPDYHCSFFYRDALRKLGWKVDIYVPWSYPQHLLYSDTDVIRPPRIAKCDNRISRIANLLLADIWFLTRGMRYRYHLYYGRPPQWMGVMDRLMPGFLSNMSLRISRMLGISLIALPSGCHEIMTKKQFGLLDGGNVCKNCGYWDRCDDQINRKHFDRLRSFFNVVVGAGDIPTNQFVQTNLKWKSLDLDLWKPGKEIPSKHHLPKTMNLRILHSFSSNGRDYEGRNIKGSPFVKAAVDRLIDEGHNVELVYVTDVASRDMRYYQAQADIVVEQLIFGWWGSTGVETMALGKPVVCYLRPAWKQFFFSVFPEYENLPIIEADTESIYTVLKELVIDQDLRVRAGQASRDFALKHFDPSRNVTELEAALLRIDKSTSCDPLVRRV